ncbi:CIC11C00000002672 [Sungouiella intermedia]|uniref:CIC11C00000002672 n=1 Tax=Sungouiella intermedia TaxID=45354 RepID=A0A1L0BZN6_9ASCO|nr:CIC11C00000002672 [[Candida] intermedia]
MLGRLFKQSTLPNLGAPSQNQSMHSSHNNPSTNGNTHDDSYTREILYASQCLSVKPLLFNPRRFRLLVCQDGGNLRSKQVLYDSAADLLTSSPVLTPGVSPATSAPVPCGTSDSQLSSKVASLSLLRNSSVVKLNAPTQMGSKNILLSKQLYNVNEINDYMFGRGLPTNESCTATKIHMLPQVNLVYGPYLAILVTRLFLIVDPSSSYAETNVSSIYDRSWHPAPAVPTKEAFFSYSGNFCKTPGTPAEGSMASRSSYHSRFAIGIVIPLESADQTAEDVLGSNLDAIAHHLVILQKVVLKKLILCLKYSTVNGVCPYINNRRIQFPQNILRSDAELLTQLNKLVKLFYFNTNVPRLINTNSLIRYSIENTDSKLKPYLLNWALEVVNWLEFKDGRNVSAFHPNGYNANYINHYTRQTDVSGLSSTFLASLLALLVPLRHLLGSNPMSVDPRPMATSKEITRVVVMTGNSAVAKKLIFILNGIIPDHSLLSQLNMLESETLDLFFDDEDNDSVLESADHVEPLLPAQHISIVSPSSITLGISASPNETSTLIKPIPIRQRTSPPSNSPSDDSCSVSVNSTRGWEVPVKSSTSLSVSSAKKSSFTTETTIGARQIPIQGRNSLSNSSSMAYLSSSLNSSLSSSASNYSLSKLGGSFMEKWKSSFTGNQHNYPSHNQFFEENLSDLSKRPSILSLRTPSPGLDPEDPMWEPTAQSLSGLSPARQKISRTQSMLDLYNHTSQTKRPVASEMPSVNLRRTMSSVYVPLQSDKGQDIRLSNKERIKLKCGMIMRTRVSLGKKMDQTLVVNPVHMDRTSSSSTFFEQSTITSEETRSSGINDSSIGDVSNAHWLPVNKKCVLPPNVAFVDEFRPEYMVQSCPLNPKLEAQVMNAMKNDLLFFQNNCGYELVTSRTVFISLRAREIKTIEMKVGGQDKLQTSTHIAAPMPPFSHSQVTPPMSSNSPVSSYFYGAEVNNVPHERRGSTSNNNNSNINSNNNNNYSTVIRKIFTSKHIGGDKSEIRKMGSHLEKLTEVVTKINNDGAATTAQEKENYNQELYRTILQLIR